MKSKANKKSYKKGNSAKQKRPVSKKSAPKKAARKAPANGKKNKEITGIIANSQKKTEKSQKPEPTREWPAQHQMIEYVKNGPSAHVEIDQRIIDLALAMGVPAPWAKRLIEISDQIITQVADYAGKGVDPGSIQVHVFDRSVHDAMTERGIK